jgi:enoyl-CoA hydratase/carnithine racemase
VITKLALRRGRDLDFDAALEYEAYLQSYAFRTEGHKQRIAAFRRSRK